MFRTLSPGNSISVALRKLLQGGQRENQAIYKFATKVCPLFFGVRADFDMDAVQSMLAVISLIGCMVCVRGFKSCAGMKQGFFFDLLLL